MSPREGLQPGDQFGEERFLGFLTVREKGIGGIEFIAHQPDLVPEIKVHRHAQNQQRHQRRDKQQAQTLQLALRRFRQGRFTGGGIS